MHSNVAQDLPVADPDMKSLLKYLLPCIFAAALWYGTGVSADDVSEDFFIYLSVDSSLSGTDISASDSDLCLPRQESVDLSEEDKGSAVRLDVYYGKTSGKAYLQLFEYVPYTYEPCSGMYEYHISTVDKLIRK